MDVKNGCHAIRVANAAHAVAQALKNQSEFITHEVLQGYIAANRFHQWLAVNKQ